MEFEELLTLLDRFGTSKVTSLELEQEGIRLKLEKGAVLTAPAATVSVEAAPAPERVEETVGSVIKAPLVGTFYAAPSPDKAPFAPVGSTVGKGQTVCVLEAMKMMSEVPAPMDCVIEAVLVKDGELVGYDTPLFRVREL